MSPLVLGEILGVFVYTMTVDGRYPVPDCLNWPLPIQMHLFEKRKKISEFLESTSNFKRFEGTDDCHS